MSMTLAMRIANERHIRVEGLVAVSWTSAPFEHACLDMPKLKHIVDRTPRFCDGQAVVLRYFRAQRLTRDSVHHLLKQHRNEIELPLFRHHLHSVDGRRLTVSAGITACSRCPVAECDDIRFAFHRVPSRSIAFHRVPSRSIAWRYRAP